MIIDTIFISLAIVFSLFYAISYWRIFIYPHTDKDYDELKVKVRTVTLQAKIHNSWAALVCSLIGWICLYILYANLLMHGFENIDIRSISINHYLLLLIGILGILGFIPSFIWSFKDGLHSLVNKFLK